MRAPRLAGLVGDPESRARERLGEPAADRPARPGRWLVWEGEGWRLRLRTGEGGTAEARRVTSWSLGWERPLPTLRGAVEPLGLWPAAAPDAGAAALDAPLARRGLEGPDGQVDRSLTATVRRGGFARVAVFDEPPEW